MLAISEKKSFDKWSEELNTVINSYYEDVDKNPSEISQSLLNLYSTAKNETDSFKKGKKFEHFVTFLFGLMGFREIQQRVLDQSRNEVDLLIRNEIDDNFLNKFGKYILVECKNYPNDGVGKNDLIQFMSKLENTTGFAELGIMITTGYIAKTTYTEAVRNSRLSKKIIFISNPQIERLINAPDIRAEFKRLIDDQVKDN